MSLVQKWLCHIYLYIKLNANLLFFVKISMYPGLGSRWWSRRTQSSPPSTNAPKIHLREEQFSLKTNWRQAETLLYNQSCKKIHTELGGKGSDQTETLCSWEGTQKMGVTWVEILPEMRASSHIFCTPAPEVWHWKDESPQLAWKSVGLTGGL